MSITRVLAVIAVVGTAVLGMGGQAVRARPGDGPGVAPQAIAPAVDTGKPIGTRFPILNESAVTEVSAAVAYNPQQQEYLVVWYNDRPGNDDIRARRVARDGTPIGTAFYVAAGSGVERRYPDVAYNSQQNEYLVVWEQYESSSGYSVRGRTVSASGTVHGSSDIIFASNPSTAVNYLQPALVYATTSDEYLLVYRYDNGSMLWQTLVAQEISSDAGTFGGSTSIVAWNTPDLPEKPDVAYNRSRNECLVVWQQQTGGSGDRDIHARRLALTGGLATAGSVLAVANTTKEEVDPAVAAVPTVPDAGNYLIVWEVDGDLYMQPVEGNGTQHTSRVLANTPWTEHAPAVAGSETRQQFLVAWVWIPVITPPAMMQVYGRAVSLAGTSLGTDAVQIGGWQVYETALAAGDVGDYLVAFDDNKVMGISDRGIYGRLWGTRIYLPLVLHSAP